MLNQTVIERMRATYSVFLQAARHYGDAQVSFEEFLEFEINSMVKLSEQTAVLVLREMNRSNRHAAKYQAKKQPLALVKC